MAILFGSAQAALATFAAAPTCVPQALCGKCNEYESVPGGGSRCTKCGVDTGCLLARHHPPQKYRIVHPAGWKPAHPPIPQPAR